MDKLRLEEFPKMKRGRPKKKPDYDKAEVNNELLEKAVNLFGEPLDDRVERSEEAPTIRDVARAMNTTTLKVRKILITAGYYSTELSRKVQSLQEQGCNVQQIMNQTGLKRASVHGYLPYSKGGYNQADSTLNAERRRIYRKRQIICEKFQQEIDSTDAERYLWDTIVAFSGYLFKKEKGTHTRYTVKDEEIFFSPKEQSVTQATMMKAFHRARQLQHEKGFVSGPKELGTFGASYLYPVFLRFDVCSNMASSEDLD